MHETRKTRMRMGCTSDGPFGDDNAAIIDGSDIATIAHLPARCGQWSNPFCIFLGIFAGFLTTIGNLCKVLLVFRCWRNGLPLSVCFWERITLTYCGSHAMGDAKQTDGFCRRNSVASEGIPNGKISTSAVMDQFGFGSVWSWIRLF